HLDQITTQSASTGNYNVAISNARGQLWRRLLQRTLDRLNDGCQRLLQRFEHFVGVEGKAARYTFGQVATTHIYFAYIIARESGADFLLDALSGGLTDQAAVVAAHIGDDGLVKAIATNTHRLCVDHTIEGDQRDFGGAATDIDHHRTTGLIHRQASTDSGGHGFFNQKHFTRTGTQCRLANG